MKHIKNKKNDNDSKGHFGSKGKKHRRKKRREKEISKTPTGKPDNGSNIKGEKKILDDLKFQAFDYNPNELLGIAEYFPDIHSIVKSCKNPGQMKSKLKALTKQIDRTSYTYRCFIKSIEGLLEQAQENEIKIAGLEKLRPDDPYIEKPKLNHRIGQIAAGAGIALTSIGAASATGQQIAYNSGSDSILTGIAVLVPLTCAGIFLKSLINSSYFEKWSVTIIRVAGVAYAIAIPICFWEIGVHFLQIDNESLSTIFTDNPSSEKPSRTSHSILFGSTLLIEILSGIFGAMLWQQMTDRIRNPKDTAIDRRIAPLKRDLNRIKAKIKRLEPKAAIFRKRLERQMSAFNLLQKLLKKFTS